MPPGRVDLRLGRTRGAIASVRRSRNPSTNCMFFAERRIMFRETEQLKQKLEEMLASNDTEWVNAVTVTLNAMYRQFQLEQQDGKQIIPLGARRISQPQIGLTCKRL